MSYILEALRRSQAQREQGRVPALDAGTPLGGESDAAPRNLWAKIAAGLAGVAVLIALYAALRLAAGPDPGEVAAGAGSAAAARPARAGPPPGVPGPHSPSGSAPPGVRAPGAASVPPAEPLVEAPPPKGQVREPPPAGSGPVPAPEARVRPPAPPRPAAVPPGAAPIPEDAAAAALEEELVRRSAGDPELSQYPEARSPPPVPEAAGPTPVPPDLIASIDAFKQEVRGGPAREKARGREARKDQEHAPRPVVAAAPPPAPAATRPAAPVAPAAPPAPAADPTRPRLTREQEASLPTFHLTAHVYDADPSRRFVLINGLKYGEGSKTREGLTVETIREDGVVLAHEGNRFFLHR